MIGTTSKYKLWEPLLFSVVTILGMMAGAKMVKNDPHDQKSEAALTNAHYSGRQVEEIIRFLETKYVGEVNSDELVTKAINKILEGLDPHTHYFPPDQMDEVEERNMGHYVIQKKIVLPKRQVYDQVIISLPSMSRLFQEIRLSSRKFLI